MSQINIIYGSTGGNTRRVCDKVSQILTDHGHNVTLLPADTSVPAELTSADYTILASPTYGHGQLEAHMLRYWWPQVQDVDLAGQKCAVIGLGDDKYDNDYTIESAAILEEYVCTHNGKLIIPALRINKSPIPVLATKVEKWAEDLVKKFS